MTRDRVGVVQAARRARLGDEAGGGVLLADEVRVDDLDRDGAAEVRLLGAVDAPHPADADEIEDDVAAGERAADERVVAARRDLADGEAARRAELVHVVARRLALRTGPRISEREATTGIGPGNRVDERTREVA